MNIFDFVTHEPDFLIVYHNLIFHSLNYVFKTESEFFKLQVYIIQNEFQILKFFKTHNVWFTKFVAPDQILQNLVNFLVFLDGTL